MNSKSHKNISNRKSKSKEGNSFIYKQNTIEGRDGNIGPIQAGFLAVWRRVPRRHLVTYSFDPAGNEVTFDQNQLPNINSIYFSR